MILDSEQSELSGMAPKCHGKAVPDRSFKRRVLTLEIDDDKEVEFIWRDEDEDCGMCR